MPNTIVKFKKYIDLLPEVYQTASCTSVLDGDSALVRAGANANEIIIPKISMDGLADYSRNSGYVKGDVTFTNETVAFNYDRGRKFSIDDMDNEETVGLAFGKLSSEFVRTKTVPELDAFRFAAYAGASGISLASANLNSGEAVLAALVEAQNTMDENEVPAGSRYLFITPTYYNLANNVDTYKSKAVFDSFAGVAKVPQSRFYTSIDMYDGTTPGETEGGYRKGTDHYELTKAEPSDWSDGYKSYYTKSGSTYTAVTDDSTPSWTTDTYYKKTASAAKDINFMIIEKSAVIQYPKHTVNKIVTPEENQFDDSWLFFFRAYGLADIYANKAAGIYLHHKA
ncbi:MAG: hypothetical protein J6C96_03915 [Oscillospiraceae bacterium]|nr:hypothetical protein [Oscillospiraceae bacterium]